MTSLDIKSSWWFCHG